MMMISHERETASSSPAAKKHHPTAARKHLPPPPKTQRLHNFTLPVLKWSGIHTVHSNRPDPDDFTFRSFPTRCPSTDLRRPLPSPAEFDVSPLASDGPAFREIEAIREKLLAEPGGLRERRAGVRPPDDSRRRDSLPLVPENSAKPSRRRSAVAKRGGWRKQFTLALTREEIEEDLFVITGTRPARRPRKRPRNILKQLDGCSCGR